MKNRKAVTLIELILVLAIIGLVVPTATSMLLLGQKAESMTLEEFDIQSDIRVAATVLNNTIRDAGGVFILHRDNANKLTEEWNYIMLNDTKDKLVEWRWDSSTNTHKQVELLSVDDGSTLDIVYNKNSKPNEDNVLEFTLTVKNPEKGDRSINSGLESMNSLQVVDRAYGKVANTLAYRNDKKLTEVSNSQAVVSMVLDTSGSMAYTLSGSWTNDYNSKRISIMKTKAIELVNEFSSNPNIYLSLVPFNTTANEAGEMLNVKANLDANKDEVTYNFIDTINGLTAEGGTNTGDGIRRGYYRITEFNERKENRNKTNKNFMIILVDGVTTFASATEYYWHTIYFNSYQGQTTIYEGRIYDYIGWDYQDRKYFYYYNRTGTSYFTGDGNVNSNVKEYRDIDIISYPNGIIIGNGSYLDTYGTEYVKKIGELVKSYKYGTNEAINVFVIGFSNVRSDYGSLKDIAIATGAKSNLPNQPYYIADSSDALEEIFASIKRQISDSLWHIGGPN
ncbi:prepilin-type N-terminal cleavage/methylation domain-containing protein [Soehngenia longivitae]|nr:prepilin-type N-terminal cleavage/methylation domain-containing protein [Soehngenia longivitae]